MDWKYRSSESQKEYASMASCFWGISSAILETMPLMYM